MNHLQIEDGIKPMAQAEPEPQVGKSIDEMVNDYNNELKAREKFPRATRRLLVQQFRKQLQKRIPK